jgi:hypothetical protein
VSELHRRKHGASAAGAYIKPLRPSEAQCMAFALQLTPRFDVQAQMLAERQERALKAVTLEYVNFDSLPTTSALQRVDDWVQENMKDEERRGFGLKRGFLG